MSDIRTWTPESDILKPGEPCSVQEIRSWFERLPRMRALIRQQQEHIESLRSAATTTTSSNSGAPGHSGTSDKVGTNSDAAIDAEAKLAELKCQYAEMQKDAIDVAYLLHADPVSIKRSRCLILSFVEASDMPRSRLKSVIPIRLRFQGPFLKVWRSWQNSRMN